MSEHGLSLPQRNTARTVSARAALEQASGVRSLYIHVPFCFHKCHYCDFYSFVDTRDQQEAFVDRLVRELAALSRHAGPLETIFVGGGTPSLLRVDLWERLLRELDELFDLSLIRRGAGEWTVECNPETVTPALMEVLCAGGVDRVSVGAQSFEPRHLQTLERWHDPANVEKAVEMAHAAGIARRSIDLIYAIPGQTLGEWAKDLDRAAAMVEKGLEHVSCYALTYEPNTPMATRLARGEFEPAGEDLDVEMFTLAAEKLGRAGLQRYEVSNYARPGKESRHNLAYWRQGQWLAAGPSASGHAWAGDTWRAGSHRWKNVPRLGDYLAFDDEGYAPIVDHEPPDPARLVRERIMMGLRLAEGLDARAIGEDAGRVVPGASERLHRAAERLVERGWLDGASMRDGVWRVTDQGWLFADAAAGELMGCVEL